MPATGRIGMTAIAIFAFYLAVGTFPRTYDFGSVCEIPAVVEVLNGCGLPGIASRAASDLRNRGFDVMYVGNADDFEYSRTMVVDRVGDGDKARAVAEVLGGVPVVYQRTETYFVEVTVVLGEDFKSSGDL